MINVACPSCGERGAISAEQVGARVKCRKCGQAFRVTSPAQKAAAAAAPQPAPPSTTLEGIVVEGLDDAWATPSAPDPAAPVSVPTAAAAVEPPPAPRPLPTPPRGGPFREYRLLSSRDKIFEGKFDLPRMEEIINQMALEGWVAKTMCLPHTKNFQGVVQEEVVVLLERESAGPSAS